MGMGEKGEGKIGVLSQEKALVLAKVLGFVYGVVGKDTATYGKVVLVLLYDGLF
jgi:hypothetical protein